MCFFFFLFFFKLDFQVLRCNTSEEILNIVQITSCLTWRYQISVQFKLWVTMFMCLSGIVTRYKKYLAAADNENSCWHQKWRLLLWICWSRFMRVCEELWESTTMLLNLMSSEENYNPNFFSASRYQLDILVIGKENKTSESLSTSWHVVGQWLLLFLFLSFFFLSVLFFLVQFVRAEKVIFATVTVVVVVPWPSTIFVQLCL